ncbi:uncharacterized protein LOC144907128 [Branchiostoma floridae x Branchiostoma belcheri]
MLEELQWVSLQERRRIARLVTFYKYHTGALCINLSTRPTLSAQTRATRQSHPAAYKGPGAAAAVPRSSQYSPGAQLTVTATCPHCGHRTEIPVVYSTHEEQSEGGHVHVTEKGNPFGEATTP